MKPPLRLAVAASGPAAAVLCVAAIDRPAASFAHASFAGRDLVFRALTHIVDPVMPAAILVLVVAGARALLGRPPGRGARPLVACAVAVALAFLFRDQAKFAFGRLWPETWVEDNPSLIRDGAYGFFPFHGGRGWQSFPSGHMTLIAAPAAVLWRMLPAWRAAVALPVALVALGLYGADYHFVGDIVAGAWLGAACGLGAAALLRAAEDRSSCPAR